MRPLLLCCFLCLAATPAAALTCLSPSIQAAFAAAHEAEEIYIPVLGRFTGFKQRSEAEAINGADRHFTARFTGRAVTARGTGGAMKVTVDVTELCLGSWCPAFTPGLEVLTFLRRDGIDYGFRVDACHGNYFADPTPVQIGTLQSCLKDMACPEN